MEISSCKTRLFLYNTVWLFSDTAEIPGKKPERRGKNMKKLFALVLALCMLCGCAAMAENDIS